MSWDFFVQDYPKNATTVEEIPDDYVPKPIGCRNDIISTILKINPNINFEDNSWGTVEVDGCYIDISLGSTDEVDSFAFHLHGSSQGAVNLIYMILDSFNLRAIDTASGDFFDINNIV